MHAVCHYVTRHNSACTCCRVDTDDIRMTCTCACALPLSISTMRLPVEALLQTLPDVCLVPSMTLTWLLRTCASTGRGAAGPMVFQYMQYTHHFGPTDHGQCWAPLRRCKIHGKAILAGLHASAHHGNIFVHAHAHALVPAAAAKNRCRGGAGEGGG